MTISRNKLKKNFEELKVTRMEDSTNLMRVQIDLFVNILKEAEDRLKEQPGHSKYKSSFLGTDKSLSNAGKELIFALLENIDYEWERLILKLLNTIDRENDRRFRKLEEEVLSKIEAFPQQMFISHYNEQMEKLRDDLLEKIDETESHRKNLVDSIKRVIEEDFNRFPHTPNSLSK